MNEKLKELLHTHPSCPFCGHLPEDYPLSGLNCKVCYGCRENINYYTPEYATIYSGGRSIEVWQFEPIAKSWADIGKAIILEPHCPFSAFEADIRKAIITYLTNEYQNLLEKCPREAADGEILKIVNRDRSTDSINSRRLTQLKSQIDPPIIATPKYIYSKSTGAIKQEEKQNQTQTSLADI